MTRTVMVGDPADLTLALLATRSPEATVCPSEVARAMIPKYIEGVDEGWRDAMPVVHAAVDRLLVQGHVRLSWKGRRLEARAGPYRISRGTDR